MEEDEVYMENDPLALYLKKENVDDFEIIETKNEEINILLPARIESQSNCIDAASRFYIESILKAQLLLEEDYELLESHYLNIIGLATDKSSLKHLFCGGLAILGAVFYKITNFRARKAILPICALPVLADIYHYVHNHLKQRQINALLNELTKFKNLIKKSLQIVGELSVTIGYYSASTISNLSLNNIHKHFAKEFYFLLLNAIKILARQSSEIISEIPLKVENNMTFEIKPELLNKTDVTVADIKLLAEIFLLVQSDFIKTLGLSFCSYLWRSPDCDSRIIFSKIAPSVTSAMRNLYKVLSNEYTILKNYGLRKSFEKMRSPQRNVVSPIHYLNSCLHSTQLHFQQLLCKSRDLQNILLQIQNIGTDERTEIIAKMLEEMDKQVISSKNMIENTIKCFNKLTKREVIDEIKVTPQATSNELLKTVEKEQKDMQPDKLLYELYIPKEGLDLSEVNIDEVRPVFSMKDLDYSGVLLEELKTILMTRNPDIYEEQMAIKKPEFNSDSEDEEYFRSRKRDIFRPTQPVGLAENLQTISHVLNLRKNMLQREDICEDTFGDSDTQEE